MSENKRFNLAFYDKYDGTFSIQDTLYLKENKYLHSLDEIVDLLNEQHEQINTLRESRRELISANNEYRMRETELAQELSTLVDENEQLKQFKNKTFDLLDKEITKNEEAIEVFEKQGSDVGAMGFYTNMLKILRKELKE